MDVRLAHPRDQYRWFLFRAYPRIDDGGSVDAWLYFLTDIHQRKLFKLDLAEKSRLQADMLNASVDCIKVIKPDGTLSHMNKAGCVALNVAEDSRFGMDWINLLPPHVHAAGRKALAEALGGQTARFQGESRAPGESMRYWDNMLTPLLDANGDVEAVLCVSRDVTQQREAERHIELLLHELNHRSKNVLAVIQALIRQSVPDPDAAFVTALERRIASIVRNQDLLILGQWTGAKVQEVIVSQTAAAGDVGEGRLLLRGDPDLRINPKAAEVLSLVVHELTTNAIKYGAFANRTGIVTVEWSVEGLSDDASFNLQWREAGGPEVAEPTRHGFGTVVIQRNPQLALRGDVTLRYAPEGLVWELKAPADAVLAEQAMAIPL